VPRRVDHDAAPAVRRVGDGPLQAGPGGDGPLHDGVGISHLQPQRLAGPAPVQRRDEPHLGVLVGEHEHAVADLHLDVADAPVGHHDRLVAPAGAERVGVEGDGGAGVDDGEVRREGVQPCPGGGSCRAWWRRCWS
jgi:hypothetical protein